STLILILPLTLAAGRVSHATSDWTPLALGMDYKYVQAKIPSSVGDSRIFILRMDPNLWQLEALGVSQTGDTSSHTARDWSQRQKLSAAINAGMFATDYKTHVGYLGSDAHINSGHVNDYQSVAAFEPHNPQSHPRFRIFDLDAPATHFDDI